MYQEYFQGNFIWWIMPLMHLAGVIIFIIIIGLIVRGIFGGRRDCLKDSDTYLDILKKRYAKGEISKEDFERMKKELRED
ncbi:MULTISPECIES: SHOCT domain-containing protein [Psychrilyobacter]|nr:MULTISPECIES: SHOCT domain-containing protein [Psychrilyobacter]MCS5422901.1 SHOCT domain-containing protein [Psychrilyobacter sp. S5]